MVGCGQVGSSDAEENVMATPVSISLKSFSATAKASVAKALQAREAAFPKPNFRIGFAPPWWLGIVIDNPVEKVTLADAQGLATDIHNGVSPAVRSLVSTIGEPGCVFGGGHIICGFIMPPDLRSFVEE
jgi:hypothetical protein